MADSKSELRSGSDVCKIGSTQETCFRSTLTGLLQWVALAPQATESGMASHFVLLAFFGGRNGYQLGEIGTGLRDAEPI